MTYVTLMHLIPKGLLWQRQPVGPVLTVTCPQNNPPGNACTEVLQVPMGTAPSWLLVRVTCCPQGLPSCTLLVELWYELGFLR